MMMDDLRGALAERGIDNPDRLLATYDQAVVADSIAAWDQKRRDHDVGPGLLVELIRKGGPAKPAPAPVGPTLLTCFACGERFDPAKARIRNRNVAPSMNCNRCLTSGYDAKRWQERFLFDAAGESA